MNKKQILELARLRPWVNSLGMPVLNEIETADEVLHFWRGQQESHLEQINSLEDAFLDKLFTKNDQLARYKPVFEKIRAMG